jgi:phospholipase C
VPGLLMVAVLAVAACSQTGPVRAAPSAAHGSGITKVMVIAEENHAYDDIIGSPDAPYLSRVAAGNGNATHVDAGYPVRCPSLAAYILLTSGTTGGICDDRAPKAHPLTGDNLFHQITASGQQWRGYAEAAPGNCVLTNSSNGRYLVRHVPATYYVADRRDCARWVLPMGTPSRGALRQDLSGGALPAYSFLSPDACHDMHGAPSCMVDRVGKADRWLQRWLPVIVGSPDYRAGRLAIIITWDEGTAVSNHIPTVVIAPGARRVVAHTPFTHCSTLRTVEEVLGLPLLGCARTAASMRSTFRL